MINRLKNLSKRGNGKFIMTFDFSTLHTKIPHSKPLKILYELTDFCFDGGAFGSILVAFAPFKKREKHPWRTVNFSKVTGSSLQTKINTPP